MSSPEDSFRTSRPDIDTHPTAASLGEKVYQAFHEDAYGNGGSFRSMGQNTNDATKTPNGEQSLGNLSYLTIPNIIPESAEVQKAYPSENNPLPGSPIETFSNQNKGEGPVDSRQPQPHDVTPSKAEQPWERMSTAPSAHSAAPTETPYFKNFDTSRAAGGNREGDGGIHGGRDGN